MDNIEEKRNQQFLVDQVKGEDNVQIVVDDMTSVRKTTLVNICMGAGSGPFYKNF